MPDTLYESFADVLSLCQSMKDDLTAILDPETGFAPRLRHLCRDRLAELEENDHEQPSQEDLDLLRLEQNTWGLLQALLPARKTEPAPLPSLRALLTENPYTPTSTLAQAIMNSSPLLSELVVVREWLHDTVPQPQHPEATTGYWKFTKHSVMQSLRTGSHRDGLVRELDPDAMNRGDGKALAADDANYEKSLAHVLYAHVRAGKLDDALETCKKAHQPWRAASIRGSLLFRWRAIANEPREYAMDEDNESWQGNRRRRLWKSACARAALNPALPDPERVLYASLAPSPQTSSVLKSACRTWEDHLWAQLSIMCEEKESSEMLRIGGGFWEGELDAVEKGIPEISQDEEQLEEEEWEKEVVTALETLKNVKVEEGPPADHAFHVSQLHIILDQTESLLELYAEGLKAGSYIRTTTEYATMARFFAHLCLFLRMIDLPVPPLATQVILESYLQVLEATGQRDLIAMYASALGDNAIERYATFLTSLQLSADITERKAALLRAREHGLDVDRVAIATAERTINHAFEILPPLVGRLPSIISLQPPPSDAEMLLVRSIEWTTFMGTTYETALEQANVILRYFLAAGRVPIAKLVLAALPIELASIGGSEERAIEYLHYRQFFNIWDTLDRVVESQAQEVLPMNTDARSTWMKDYKDLVGQARDQILKLLTSDWLVTDVEKSGGDRRRRELIRIRQMYIPELIIRLHSLLLASRQRMPENLRLALELAKTVADSRYKLYEDFVNEDGKRLGDYLSAVRQAILVGLASGGSDPFLVIHDGR